MSLFSLESAQIVFQSRLSKVGYLLFMNIFLNLSV